MVQVSESVARWILTTGTRIITEAFNSEWDPLDPNFVTREIDNHDELPMPGYMDELANHGLSFGQRNWLNAMIQLIRTITSICANGLPADALGYDGGDEEGGILNVLSDDKEN